jgi:hypothetical protein
VPSAQDNGAEQQREREAQAERRDEHGGTGGVDEKAPTDSGEPFAALGTTNKAWEGAC